MSSKKINGFLSDSRWETRLERINGFDGNLVYGGREFNRKTHRTGRGRPSSEGLIPEHAFLVEDTGQERFRRKPGHWMSLGQCPVCSVSERRPFVHRLGLDFHECMGCGHVFQDPVITAGTALQLYRNDQTAPRIYRTDIQRLLDQKKYDYGLELMEAGNPPAKVRILDFGCGPGGFLKRAKARGWSDCVGIDVNEAYQEEFEGDRSVRFLSCDFMKLDTGVVEGAADAIALWSVLEHVHAPGEFIARLGGLMKPGGVMLVLVPNVKSLATCLMREMSPCFNWQHVSYFSPDSLRKLLRDNGFEEVILETVITEIDNIKSYMSGQHPYEGNGDPEGIFNFLTPDFIHRHLLGSRILAVFRKP